jgi:hypothetical protein
MSAPGRAVGGRLDAQAEGDRPDPARPGPKVRSDPAGIIPSMSKRARRRNHRPAANRPAPPTPRPTGPQQPAISPAAPVTPERLLLDQVADGALDHSLHALADAIHARQHLLHTVQAATALAQLCVGDVVCINHTIKPHYLCGAQGRIVDLDDHTATVCLHRPIGRFTSGRIRCPPLALDRLAPAD